jgi:hypothetical protein
VVVLAGPRVLVSIGEHRLFVAGRPIAGDLARWFYLHLHLEVFEIIDDLAFGLLGTPERIEAVGRIGPFGQGLVAGGLDLNLEVFDGIPQSQDFRFLPRGLGDLLQLVKAGAKLADRFFEVTQAVIENCLEIELGRFVVDQDSEARDMIGAEPLY